MNGEPVTDVGLVDYGPHGLHFLNGVELFEYFENVADTEELVGVLKHFGLVRGEVGGKWTLGRAPSPLVFARSASLACATLEGHFFVERTMPMKMAMKEMGRKKRNRLQREREDRWKH